MLLLLLLLFCIVIFIILYLRYYYGDGDGDGDDDDDDVWVFLPKCTTMFIFRLLDSYEILINGCSLVLFRSLLQHSNGGKKQRRFSSKLVFGQK